jgi:phosphoglycolate phosphatase
MGPPALLFDLDGTLVDSARGIAAALSTLSKSRGGGQVDVERVRVLVSLGVEEVVASALGPLVEDLAEDVSEFRAILASAPADPASVYPGVRTALEQLEDRGHRMAVVTNKPEQLARQLLCQLDLGRFFGAVVGGDTLTTCKPDPGPLRHALTLLRAENDHAIMVGDSGFDAMAAISAGVSFGLFLKGYGSSACPRHNVAFEFDDFALLTRGDIMHMLSGTLRHPSGHTRPGSH